MADFFISRNAADHDWAEWIAWHLEQVGKYSVVLQDWDFRPGENFPVRMDDELRLADRMIVVLSPSYLGAEYSQAEWTSFFHADPVGREGRLLVVRVRPAEAPFLLRPIVRIDLDTAPDEKTAERRLMAGVERGRLVPRNSPPFPGGRGPPVGLSAGRPEFPPRRQEERGAAATQSERDKYEASRKAAHAGTRVRVVGQPSSVQSTFYDRIEARRKLHRILATPGARLISVIGHRGIGKSALVDHVLTQLEEGLWDDGDGSPSVDGIIYISTRSGSGEISLERIFLDCARLLGGASQRKLEAKWAQHDRTDAEKVEALLRELGDRVVVILLDNLDDVMDSEGALNQAGLRTFFDMVFRARRSPRLVITSEQPLSLDPAVVRLDRRILLEEGLPDADAVAMFREMDEVAGVGLSETAEVELLEAVHRVGGNPLGIEMVFGAWDRSRTSTLRELVAGLDTNRNVLDQLVSESYRNLDEDARTVVQALAVLRRSVPAAAIEFLVEPFLPGVRSSAIVSRLMRAHHVVHSVKSSTLSLHPMNADFTLVTLSEEDPTRRTALECRAADWYRSFRLPEDRWITTDDLEPQLLEFDHLVNAGMINEAARSICDVANFLVWHGSSRRLLASLQRIDGRITDPELQARHAFAMGLALHVTGPLVQASQHFARARDAAENLGLKQLHVQALAMSGEASRLLGRLDDAMRDLRRASVLAASIGDDETQQRALRLLGLGLAYKGRDSDLRRAEATVQRLHRLAAGPKAALRQAQALDLSSLVSFLSGRYEHAVTQADAAMAGFDEARYPWAIGYVRNVRGMALLALDRGVEASEEFEHAQRDGQAVEASRVEGLASYNLAWSEYRQANIETAVKAAERAIQKLSGQSPGEHDAATGLHSALVAIRTGDTRLAAQALVQAAQASARNADLYPGSDLAQVAESLARSVGDFELAAVAVEVQSMTATPQYRS